MEFYLQDSRGFSGNHLWFWKKGRAGYTADIREAEVFTKESALSQNRCRETDIPWLKSYIDDLGDQCIDMQKVNRAAMLKSAKIKLKKAKKVRPTTGKTRHNCPCCGKIVWDFNPYDAPACSSNCEFELKYS